MKIPKRLPITKKITIDAWDRLYGETHDLVWGLQPSPFLHKIIRCWDNKLTANSKILDAGTGEGRNLPLLMETGAELFACDASENALRKLSALFNDEIHITQCELDKTPFDDNFFEIILMNDVFETLPDPYPIMLEMTRLLSPDGQIICNIPSEDDSVSTDCMQPLNDCGALYMNKYFYKFWNEDDAIEVFEKCGLKVVMSKLYSWTEEAHPGFRAKTHNHTSCVLVGERATKKT